MKKKKIYKILSVVFVVSLIFSLVTVNASAFEREPMVDIPGDEYDRTYQLGIFAENYAIINCGALTEITSGISSVPLNINQFKLISELNTFLDSACNGVFTSPTGMYTYDHISVEYLEFFTLTLNDVSLEKIGTFKVGEISTIDFGQVFVHEVTPGLSYSFEIDSLLYDNIYFGAPEQGLYVACYFNGFTPYDELFDSSNIDALNKRISELESSVSFLETEKKALLDVIESRDTTISSLQSEVEYLRGAYERECQSVSQLTDEINVLEQRKNDLQKELFDMENMNTILQKELFEMENANALDEIFTGTSTGLLTIIRGIADLGYSPAPGINVTIGGLLVVAVLGAFLIFILRLIFGGAKSG